MFYDQDKEHRWVSATAGGPGAVGRKLRRAGRCLSAARTDEVLAIVFR